MATKFNISPKRRKVRRWIIYITLEAAIDDLLKSRTSADKNIYIRISDPASGTALTMGNFQAIGQIGVGVGPNSLWKYHEVFTSFELAKSEMTRLADKVAIQHMNLVTNVDLITDFLPRS